MKSKLEIFIAVLIIIMVSSCKNKEQTSCVNIIFLHHSTGEVIWRGGNKVPFITKVVRKINTNIVDVIDSKALLPSLFKKFNEEYAKNYKIKELIFPKATPYGWNNFPFDYYNIWVKNAGNESFMEEPTLELLTKDYQVIIFKHCFPVCNIKSDTDSANVNSKKKTLENYRLQYSALKDKINEFPGTKFILFTGAARVKSSINEDEALKAAEFFDWVVDEWDTPDDNIFLWDLYSLQTEGSLYFKDEYTASPFDSHPNAKFAEKAAKLLFNRIIDVIENDGNNTFLTGEEK